jgi:hypothetical protein
MFTKFKNLSDGWKASVVLLLWAIAMPLMVYAYDSAYTGAQVDQGVANGNAVGGVTGVVKSDGANNISAAAAGTDYLAPNGDGSGLSGVVTSESDPILTALFDAQTILYATSDNTPAALTVTEQTVVGRATGGNIAALAIDSDLSTVSANDDTVPSAKATKAALDAKQATLTNSAGLAAALSDETGTGAAVFATSPGFTTAANPVSADGAALGTTALEWSDLFLADGGIIYFGNDQDVTLTHIADTGLQLNTAMQLRFRDSAIHIESADDGHLDITADTSIDLNGLVTMNTIPVGPASDCTTDYQYANKHYVDSVAAGGGLPTTGGTMTGNITLDDGSTDSPSIIFTDETDETATFTKTDSGFLGLTTVAADGLNILVGNLKVGNGTPDQTLNGEDGYIEGGLEVDGPIYADGGIVSAAVASPVLYLKDSDASAGDINWQLGINATDTGDGSEDVDIDEKTQIAGTLTTVRAVDADGSYTIGSAGMPVVVTDDLTVTGGDIVLGTTSIFSGGDTASLNNIDAIDATTEATIEAALDTFTTLSIGSITGVNSIDGTGAVDMDYGSADITDHTFTSDGGTVILDGSVTASAGMNLGTSQALVGTTAMTIGNNGQTIAINSSDWDIDATGIMTGMGAITSNGAITGTSIISPIYDVTGAAGITFGSADVTTFTFSGQSEDLVFTPSADTWTLSSSTGVTAISAGTIDIETTGKISGGIVTNSKAAGYTIGTDDPREMYGGIIYVTSDATLVLPAVADGMSVTVVAVGATTVTIDPNGSDLIVRDGTAQADGVTIVGTGTAGDICVITYYDATGWYAATNSWTQGS